MKLIVSILISVLSICIYGSSIGQNPINDIDIFNSFIGDWVAPDSASVYKMDPSRKGKVFFSFEKGSYDRFLIVTEDFSRENKGNPTFYGLVCLNPLSGNYEFFGSNARDGFLFKGFFDEVTSNSFVRHYEVFYPKEHPMAQNAGQVIAFKEKFELIDANTIMFDLKYYSKKDKVWRNWMPGKHVLVRKKYK